MKLRIQSNSIRIRLTQSEASALAAGKAVTDSTSFSRTVRLISSIETSDVATTPSASLESCRLIVVLPLASTRQWANSDQVSIQYEQCIDEKHSLALLIEKDFECLHHREENADAFPNPRNSKMR